MLFCHVYYHQKAKYYKHIAIQELDWTCWKCQICERVQLLQKGIIDNRMLKVNPAQKGRTKYHVRDSTWIQRLFNLLPSQIKFDDIPLEVKLDDVNNTEIEKARKSNKMQTQILFKLCGGMFF